MRERVGYLPDIGEEVVESKILTFTGKGESLEVEAPLLTIKQMQQVAEKVKQASAEVLKNMTIAEIISIIDTAIEVLLDRNSIYRKKAERLLPIVTGYDEEMIRLGPYILFKKVSKT